jgi:hypothetical protein
MIWCGRLPRKREVCGACVLATPLLCTSVTHGQPRTHSHGARKPQDGDVGEDPQVLAGFHRVSCFSFMYTCHDCAMRAGCTLPYCPTFLGKQCAVIGRASVRDKVSACIQEIHQSTSILHRLTLGCGRVCSTPALSGGGALAGSASHSILDWRGYAGLVDEWLDINSLAPAPDAT